jgi:hypothetical protein
MKNLYTYAEIKDKINSGDSIKYTEIEKMLRHLMLHYTCLEWERDEARNEIKRLKNGSYLQSLSMSHAKSALNDFSK